MCSIIPGIKISFPSDMASTSISIPSRYLSINNIGYIDNLDVLIDIIFSELEKKMRDEPAAWHFWSESERFFIK